MTSNGREVAFSNPWATFVAVSTTNPSRIKRALKADLSTGSSSIRRILSFMLAAPDQRRDSW
jgi:hypothetical protein